MCLISAVDYLEHVEEETPGPKATKGDCDSLRLCKVAEMSLVDMTKDSDQSGLELARQGDPLKTALRYAQSLSKLHPERCSTWLALFDVYWRQGRFLHKHVPRSHAVIEKHLKALQALRCADQLDSGSVEVLSRKLLMKKSCACNSQPTSLPN